MTRWIAQRVLDAMPIDGSIITTQKLAEATGLSRKDASRGIDPLCRRLLVSVPKPGRYRLLPAGRAAKASVARIDSGSASERAGVQVWEGTFRERAWRALRQLKKATALDLVELAGTGQEKDPESSARKYLWVLQKAGYVVAMPSREPGVALTSGGLLRYMLLPDRDTGPKPPIYRERKRSVFDQNTGEEYFFAPDFKAVASGGGS